MTSGSTDRHPDASGKTILVTGGAGFIGSHTCVELLESSYDVVVLDDLSNSSEEALRRVEEIAGKKISAFYKGNACNPHVVDKVFRGHEFAGVIHFAAFKAVGESVEQPRAYYQNNLSSTLNVIRAMQEHGVKNFVFSSSATVYGDPDVVPCTEETALKPATSPYGWTKSMNEQILRDIAAADPSFTVMILRYFNPIGAHPSGRIGEDPKGIPNNLVPYVAKVAVGELPAVRVFGIDYDTPDGTGVRDYIHVVDLARGHVQALEYMQDKPGVHVFNLGTGKGSSVLDVIRAFSRACGKDLPYVVKPRRGGDIAQNYADPTRARRLMGWSARYDLDKMCEDSWRWQSTNPEGYGSPAQEQPAE